MILFWEFHSVKWLEIQLWVPQSFSWDISPQLLFFQVMIVLLNKQNSFQMISTGNFHPNPFSVIFMRSHLNSLFCLHPLITFASLSILLLSKCNLNASHKSPFKLSSIFFSVLFKYFCEKNTTFSFSFRHSSFSLFFNEKFHQKTNFQAWKTLFYINKRHFSV